MPNNARHGTKVWRYRSTGGANTRLTLGVPRDDGGDPTGFPILNRTVSSRHYFGCAIDCWLRVSVEWFKESGANQVLISTDPMGPVSRFGGSTNWTEINRIIVRQKGMTHWRQVLEFYSTDPRLTDGVGAPLPANTDVFIDDMYVPDNGLTLPSDEPYLDGDQRGARWEGPAYRSPSVWVLKPDEMPNVFVIPEAIVITADPPPPLPPAPVADFTSSATNLTVAFTDTSTGSPTQWAWTFGDGTTSTAQNPAKTYASAGTYTVTLTATNGGGSNTTTKSVTVTAPVPATRVIDTFTAAAGTTINDRNTDSGHRWAVDVLPASATIDASGRLLLHGDANNFWQMATHYSGSGAASRSVVDPANSADIVSMSMEIAAAAPASANIAMVPLRTTDESGAVYEVWLLINGSALLPYYGSNGSLSFIGNQSDPGEVQMSGPLSTTVLRKISVSYTKSTGDFRVWEGSTLKKTWSMPVANRASLAAPSKSALKFGQNSTQTYTIDNYYADAGNPVLP